MADPSTPRPYGLQSAIALRELVVTPDANISSVATAPSVSVGSGAPTDTKPQGSIYLRSDGAADTVVYVNTNGATAWSPLTASSAGKIVHATIAVADASGGATDAALTVSLQQVDNSTDLAAPRQVMIASGAAQYAPRQALNGNVTFGTATTGSIIDSGNGWALVLTDVSGDFACTATNASDEAVYFWCESAHKVSAHQAGCVVAASNSDLATWSA
jgi:hypothetical protein